MVHIYFYREFRCKLWLSMYVSMTIAVQAFPSESLCVFKKIQLYCTTYLHPDGFHYICAQADQSYVVTCLFQSMENFVSYSLNLGHSEYSYVILISKKITILVSVTIFERQQYVRLPAD